MRHCCQYELRSQRNPWRGRRILEFWGSDFPDPHGEYRRPKQARKFPFALDIEVLDGRLGSPRLCLFHLWVLRCIAKHRRLMRHRRWDTWWDSARKLILRAMRNRVIRFSSSRSLQGTLDVLWGVAQVGRGQGNSRKFLSSKRWYTNLIQSCV